MPLGLIRATDRVTGLWNGRIYGWAAGIKSTSTKPTGLAYALVGKNPFHNLCLQAVFGIQPPTTKSDIGHSQIIKSV
jgi:hypothetical protein